MQTVLFDRPKSSKEVRMLSMLYHTSRTRRKSMLHRDRMGILTRGALLPRQELFRPIL